MEHRGGDEANGEGELLERCALMLLSVGGRSRKEMERRLALAFVFGEQRDRARCAEACTALVGSLLAAGVLAPGEEDDEIGLSEAGQQALEAALASADEHSAALSGHARNALEEVVDRPQARMFADRLASLIRLIRRLEGRPLLAGEARMMGEVARVRLREAFVAPPARRVSQVRDIIDFLYTQAVALEYRERGRGQPRHIRKEHVKWHTVRKGVAAARVEMNLRHGPVLANLLRVDPRRVALRAVDLSALPEAERTLPSLMAAHGAQEGTSGGFFLYSEPDITPPQRAGDPVGLLVQDGEVRCPPLFHRAALLVDEAGHVHIRRVGLKGTMLVWEGGRLLLRAVNRPRQGAADVIGYSRVFGQETPEGCGRTVTIIKRTVTAMGRGVTPIPLLGLVVALPEDSIADTLFASLSGAVRVGYEIVTARGEGRIAQAMAGGPLLVHEGELALDLAADDFLPGLPPVTFSDDATQGRNLLPRLAWGVLEDHRLLAIAIDGRNVERSVGESLEGLARTLRALGCVTALNFDGGSSKRMAVDGEIVDLSTTALVTGADDGGSVRPLSSAWLVVPR